MERSLSVRNAVLTVALAWLLAPTVHAQPAPRIKVGVVVPLSGPLAAVGREVVTGTRAHIEALNRTGGFAGRQIELVSADDGNDPKRSAEAVADIIAKHQPIAFVNCFGTVGCAAQSNALRGQGIALVGPIAGAESLRGSDQKHVFAVRPSAVAEVRTLIEHTKEMGVRELTVIYQDDGFGRAYLPIAQKLIPQMGVTMPTVVRLDPAKPEYAKAAQQVADPGTSKSVLLLTNVQHSAEVLKAMREHGIQLFAMNLAGQANAQFIDRTSGVSSYSVFAAFTPSPWKRSIATTREYQDAWRRVTPDQPFSYLGYEAFINTRVFAEALLRADRRINAERYMAALESMPAVNFDGFTVRFGADNRQGSEFVDLAVLSSRRRFEQ